MPETKGKTMRIHILRPTARGRTGLHSILNVFTLIELLTVVTIVTFLISILLPALSSARESGRKIMCAGKMKMLAPAALNYSDDNNGYLPLGVHGDSFFSKTFAPYLGYNAKGGYVNGGKYLVCPSENYKFVEESSRSKIGLYPAAATYMGTVTSRGAMPTTAQWGGWQCFLNSTDNKRLMQVIPNSVLMSETALYGYGDDGTGQFGFFGRSWPRPDENNLGSPTSSQQPPSPLAPFYHRMSSNYLFLDGHVSNYRCGYQFDTEWRAVK